MRKRLLPNILLLVGIPSLLFTSCVDDRYLTVPPPVADQSHIEEFDTVAASLSRGWMITNASTPKGSNIWQQGGEVMPWFSPFSSNGTYAGFIGADYTSTSAAAGIISNWLISPPVTFQNGDKIIFYTRALQYDDGAGDSTDYGNRLQVRLNLHNEGLNVGSGSDAGDFDTPLLDINPTYEFSSIVTPSTKAYPANWTRFEATVYGLSKPVRGRYAFRYFIEGGGWNGLGSGVGIDYVTYQSVGR
ncbi:choice-of-anchor J domain-containing protein [Aridibaculum aurantiacum]|uniref:choice-of-anchor J domain-containing protein n=1 Tax=Aridibaculum aurantiacum TaxID=2810307 RepID=UPI001A97D2FA|nr:choice-of-anchor J domain-containing protein [Aridibaculum aurantiacum]